MRVVKKPDCSFFWLPEQEAKQALSHSIVVYTLIITQSLKFFDFLMVRQPIF